MTSGELINGSIPNPVSVTEYQAFDQLGRVTQSQQWVEGTTYGDPMNYTYNLSGALIEQKYPSSRVVKNVLDNDGDLSIVQSKKTQTSGYWNYADNFTYSAAGAVTSMQLGNGRWESTVFNSRLQPTQIALGAVANGTDKLKLNFTYNTVTNGNPNADNNGNVLSQTIVVPTEVRGTTTHNGFTATQVYTYDSLNRIKQATETVSGQSGNNWQQTFEYDRFGNRTFNEAGTTVSDNFPKDCSGAMCPADKKKFNPQAQTADNKFSTSDGYLYDNAGNTTRNADNRKFTYDAENKQTKVETVDVNGNPINTLGEYFYDGDGKRVKKIAGAEVTIFVYDAAGKLVAEYANQISQSPQVSYLTSDHLGSPRINTDANGAVTARHDYQPFGEEIARASYGADAVRKQFATYERDRETELDFAQARYYAKNIGRFNSTDPLMASARQRNPQTFNRYSYVVNNPLNLIDPLGLMDCPPDNPQCNTDRHDKDGKKGDTTVDTGDEIQVTTEIDCGGDGNCTNSNKSSTNNNHNNASLALFGHSPHGDGIAGGAAGGAIVAEAAPGLVRQAVNWFLRRIGLASASSGVTAEMLRRAAQDPGPTVRVVTNLTQKPQIGRALSVAVETSDDLAGAARANGQIFVAKIPKALVDTLIDARLAEYRNTMMNGVQGKELYFLPGASEWVVPFFK